MTFNTDITKAMMAHLSGDKDAAQAALDQVTLRRSIVSHRTFFCPFSEAFLDVNRAVAVELSNGELIGPYDLPGCARKAGADPDEIKATMLSKAQAVDPDARLLDGPALFGGSDAKT